MEFYSTLRKKKTGNFPHLFKQKILFEKTSRKAIISTEYNIRKADLA